MSTTSRVVGVIGDHRFQYEDTVAWGDPTAYGSCDGIGCDFRGTEEEHDTHLAEKVLEEIGLTTSVMCAYCCSQATSYAVSRPLTGEMVGVCDKHRKG